MAIQPTKLKTRDASGVTYAATTKPDLTVRFKTNTGSKRIGSATLSHVVSEVIYNDVNLINTGGSTVAEPISVRLRLSSSLDSRARLSEILADLSAKVLLWDSEDAFIGFEPATAPGVV